MKINKRLLLESIIVSVLVLLIGFGWEIVQGMLLTRKYVPDIMNSYNSADYLQHKVSFGILYGGNWILSFVSFLILVFLYYGFRLLLNYMRRNFKGKKRTD